jgi:opacity protein-like surface antigen
LAALQGVDLEKEQRKSANAWEDLKARVFSGGKAQSSDDIVSLTGINAQKAGFGIGAGLEYNDLRDLENPSW